MNIQGWFLQHGATEFAIEKQADRNFSTLKRYDLIISAAYEV